MDKLPQDLPGLETFVKVTPITEGWSPDHKFYVENAEGQAFFLRVDRVTRTDRVGYEIRYTNRFARAGVPMQKTVRFGVCGEGKYLYQLLTWIPGEQLETLLNKTSPEVQYELGMAAGKIMKTINEIETYPASSWWNSILSRIVGGHIAAYKNCGKTHEKGALLLDYVEKSRPLWANRPMCLAHNDLHLGNFVLSPENVLHVIDFDRYGEIDPYWSFKSAAYNAMVSPRFVTGQIHGYFDGEPPEDFWPLFASYMAVMAIAALPAACEGEGFKQRQVADILSWFDDMRESQAAWYGSNA